MSDLSDRELDTQVAEKVMRWTPILGEDGWQSPDWHWRFAGWLLQNKWLSLWFTAAFVLRAVLDKRIWAGAVSSKGG